MIRKNCAFCGKEFLNKANAAQFCSKECYAKSVTGKKHPRPKAKPKEKRKSQIDAKLKQSNGKYGDLQKAETISLYARVIIEAS